MLLEEVGEFFLNLIFSFYALTVIHKEFISQIFMPTMCLLHQAAKNETIAEFDVSPFSFIKLKTAESIKDHFLI